VRAESRGVVPRSYRIGLGGWKSKSSPLLQNRAMSDLCLKKQSCVIGARAELTFSVS